MANTKEDSRIVGRAALRHLGLPLLLAAPALLWFASQGYRPLFVYSGSMSPAIRTGAVAIVRPVAPQSLVVGDVASVALEGQGHLITHRVQAIQIVDGQTVFQTKGDANKFPDPQPFIVKHSVGKVVLDVPWIGFAIVYASSPLARSAIVALLLYVVLTRRSRKPASAEPNVETEPDSKD
jgi:signal peptidase I